MIFNLSAIIKQQLLLTIKLKLMLIPYQIKHTAKCHQENSLKREEINNNSMVVEKNSEVNRQID